ncbi:MFS general substrate transporter [Coprinellus micaceus]|uniref:MFS general substrate transporter n=1 Tax=Coprinellus micaceus TaxID=71717 RepID=A0A4Y7SYS2_COPMI|nr:MFS general substrate transporter [Coprinellus micaceus]
MSEVTAKGSPRREAEERFADFRLCKGYANGVIGSVNTRGLHVSSIPSRNHVDFAKTKVLTRIYGPEALSKHAYSRTLSSLAFAGTVVGMLLFGYLSDKIGRKFGMMTATAIVVVFSGLSAASSGANGSIGEYPCGSVSASEQSEESGISKKAQHRWFTLATTVFLWRLRMEEPARYKKDSMKARQNPVYPHLEEVLGVIGGYLVCLASKSKSLICCSMDRFLYDIIVYPFGIFSSIIVDNVTGGISDLQVVFGWNVVINLFYMPGTLIGAFIVDYLGPKYTMITGLVLQAIIGFIMSGLYKQLTSKIAGFAVVYGIFLSFGELGTFYVKAPEIALVFLRVRRARLLSVASTTAPPPPSEKVGAFVGTWMFPPIIEAFGGAESTRGNTGPFWIASGLALLSAIVVFFFVTPLTHDGMEKEDRAFRQYLEDNGFDTVCHGSSRISIRDFFGRGR